MFKKEIKFITDLNLNKLQILGDRLRVDDILKSDIHPAIIKFISGTIDLEIYHDRIKIETDSKFNYNNERILNYFSLIGEEIKRSQIFELDYLKDLLHSAVSFNVKYLITPNLSLERFIFGQDEIKTVEEVYLNLKRVYYYKYLQKILFSYLDKKQVILIRKSEFTDLLSRIDQLSKETHLDNIISTSVNSMANFLDPNSKGSETIPLFGFQKFLDEKKYTEYSDKLFETYGDDPSIRLSPSDIINTMKTVIPVSEMEIADPQNLDDQFSLDNSTGDESSEKNDQEIMEVDEDNKTQVDEIFEVEDDEHEIPNDEILSSEKIESEDPHEEIESSSSNPEDEEIIIDEDSNADSNEDSSDENKDELKKKVNLINNIDKLFNIDDYFNQIIHTKTPFQTNDHATQITDLSKIESSDLNYKLEISTLKEEIEEDILSHGETDNKEFQGPDPLGDNTINENDEVDIDQILKFKSEFDSANIEGSNSDDVEEVNSNSADLLDESELRLSDDNDLEVTEVFTDLMYLDDSQDSEDVLNSSFLKMDSEEDKITETDFNSSQEVFYINSEYSFEDMILQRDMTKIIESIFDYDMEDYHLMIDNISNSKNESDAIKITEKYCKENHIEITSDEVNSFKSIISEYFTKIPS